MIEEKSIVKLRGVPIGLRLSMAVIRIVMAMFGCRCSPGGLTFRKAWEREDKLFDLTDDQQNMKEFRTNFVIRIRLQNMDLYFVFHFGSFLIPIPNL